MQSGGINLYVKLVLMTAKIKFYFWKKKVLSHFVLKSVKTCYSENYIYRGLVSAVCVCTVCKP